MVDSIPLPTPHKLLAIEVLKFIADIECLNATLPLTMSLVGLLENRSGKKFNEFLAKEAIEQKEKENGIITYTLNTVDVKTADILNHKLNNFQNASRLIPRHFVISLVSQYDYLLGKIIRFIFTSNPEMLNSTEKSLRYTDLIAFESIPAAQEYLIEKEVESIIRKSHSDQFEWLTKRLKIPFTENLKSWPNFIELTERRNLFVHCDGKVSSQYIKVCTENKCAIDSCIKLGEELKVTKVYFNNAYRCIYEIGIKLSQVIWRQLYRNELEEPDANLIDITYRLIDRGEYELAIKLLDFFTGKPMKHANDTSRRMLIVNKAQAYKWIKDEKRCLEILALEDWTACDDRFKIGISVLRDDFESAYNLMKILSHNTEFDHSSYADWPIFKKFRQEEKFKVIYKECYGKDFRIEKSTGENLATKK